MIFTIFVSFLLAVIFSILLVTALQVIPSTRLFLKPPYLLNQGFSRCRVNLMIRAALVTTAAVA
ncbi:MAG: hypothetical protein ACRCT7_17445, partial [Shewanella sp.]